jgi:hypothetical protein
MDWLLVTRQGVDAAYVIPDNVSRLGAAVEGSNPLKRPPSCAYKAPRRSPLCLSIFSFASSSCVILRFSFVIYLLGLLPRSIPACLTVPRSFPILSALLWRQRGQRKSPDTQSMSSAISGKTAPISNQESVSSAFQSRPDISLA